MNWSIKKKLYIGFLSMIGLVMFLAFTIITKMNHISELQDRVIGLRAPTSSASLTLLSEINGSLASLRGYMLLKDEKFKSNRSENWKKIDAEMKSLAYLSVDWTNPNNVYLLGELRRLLLQFRKVQQQIEDISNSKENTPASLIYSREAQPLAASMLKHLTVIINMEKSLNATTERKELLFNLADIRASLAISINKINSFLGTGDSGVIKEYNEQWKINFATVKKINLMKELFSEKQNLEYELFMEKRNKIYPLIDKIILTRRDRKLSIGRELLANKAAPLGEECREILKEMSFDQKQLMIKDLSSLNDQINEAQRVIVYIVSFSIALGLILSFLILRSILKPIETLISSVKKVSAGDINHNIAINTKDEISVLGEHFNIMTDRLQDVNKHAKLIASGNYKKEIVLRGDNDELGFSLQKMQETLQNIVHQTIKISEGDFSHDIQPKNKDDELGHAMLKMVLALESVSSICESVAKGDFSRRIELEGLNDKLGKSVNTMVLNLQEKEREAKENERNIFEKNNDLENQYMLRTSVSEFNEILRSQCSLVELCSNVLNSLSNYISFSIGGLYLKDDYSDLRQSDDIFKLVSSVAMNLKVGENYEFISGQGILGQCVAENNRIEISSISDERLTIKLGVGEISPAFVLLEPLVCEQRVIGVLELGFIEKIDDTSKEFINQVSENISIAINSNISRLKLEISHQKIENQISALDEHAIVSIADLSGKITYVNDKFCAVSGYDREELIGKHHRVVKSEEHDDAFWKNFWSTISSGNVWQGQIKNISKSGEIYWVDSTIVPMKNSVGEVIEYMGIRRDITEMKNLELNLQGSHQQINNQMQALDEHAIVSIADLSGKITYVNDKFCAVSGYDREELIGKHHRVVKSNEHDDAFWKNFWSTISSGKVWQGQIKNISKSGGIYWVDSTIVPMKNSNGDVIEYMGIRRDITEIKNLELNLQGSNQQINNQMLALDEHAIVSIADLSGKITYVNDKFCAVSGYDREELIGKHHRVVKSDEHDDAFWKNFWSTISSGKVWQGQIKNISKSGEVYWVDSTIVPMKSSDGKVIEYMGIRRDITELKELEDNLKETMESKTELLDETVKQKDDLEQRNVELTELQDKLVESSKMASLGSMAAGIAHEINQPLGAISINSENIAHCLAKGKYDSAVKMASQNVEQIKRATKIINALRMFSREEHGVEVEKCNLNFLTNNIIALLENEFKLQGITLSKNLDKRLSDIEVAQIQIEQVISNLLTNARDAVSESGKKEISVKTYDDHGCSILEVSDSGCGISEENRSKIFDPFYTTKEIGKGTGLGLSLSIGMIQSNGGEIDVKSEVDIGTTFTISFRSKDMR